MGASPQTPGIYRLKDQSMRDERQCQDQQAPPLMLQSPATALRLLPSIALSSELAPASYLGGNKYQGLTDREVKGG